MVRKADLEGIRDILKGNNDSEIKISRSFLEDLLSDYTESLEGYQFTENITGVIAVHDFGKANKNTFLVEPVVMEATNNDAYSFSCECPKCGKRIHRGEEEKVIWCENCGTKLHLRAFTDEEVDDGRFQRQMDNYEDL